MLLALNSIAYFVSASIFFEVTYILEQDYCYSLQEFDGNFSKIIFLLPDYLRNLFLHRAFFEVMRIVQQDHYSSLQELEGHFSKILLLIAETCYHVIKSSKNPQEKLVGYFRGIFQMYLVARKDSLGWVFRNYLVARKDYLYL